MPMRQYFRAPRASVRRAGFLTNSALPQHLFPHFPQKIRNIAVGGRCLAHQPIAIPTRKKYFMAIAPFMRSD